MTIVRSLLIIASVPLTTVAAASPPIQSMAVEVGDLDLESDKGRRILALRIGRAAKAMCKSDAVERMPQNIRDERKCVRDARASARSAAMTLNAASDPMPDRTRTHHNP
jgi:UrcA family protein